MGFPSPGSSLKEKKGNKLLNKLLKRQKKKEDNKGLTNMHSLQEGH